MTDNGVDVVVVGAGVVGCAVASTLARRGRSVVVLEADARPGDGISSRNSGVIHSGLYYLPGSLKALSCVRGQALLYAWAQAHGVWHSQCGKLVVASTQADVPALEALAANAQANGATGLEMLTAGQTTARQPGVNAVAALWCPLTGVVDAPELVASLAADAQEHGAMVLTHAQVTALQPSANGWSVTSHRGPLDASFVVNAAGLHADHVARLAGVTRYRIHPCRGDYFRLRTRVAFRHLVYPVATPHAAGLGVHVTLSRGGGVRLGPDTTWVEQRDDFSGGQHKRAAFAQAAARLLGPVAEDDLTHDGCGIRPKLRAPGDAQERDFVLAMDRPSLINLVGIESPGLTAALDLAQRVADLVN